jgi:hypothetical protein
MIAPTRAAIVTSLWLIPCLFVATVTAEAQVPSISSTSPQAVQPGQSIDVTIRGANLTGASQLWRSFSSKTVLSPDVKDNGKNKAEVVFRVAVSEDAAVGVHGIRVATPGGVSAMKLLVVDDLHSVSQQSGNTTRASAQTVSLPIAVDGVVASLGRHYFKFSAKAGQRLSFEVLARRIGSPLDPMIVIYDPAGREVVYNDDALGLSGDAQISHIFDVSGDHILELRDISYRGGNNYAFRLRMGDFPCVTTPYPMGAKRGKDVALFFAGSDIDSLQRVDVRVPADPNLDSINVGVKRAGGTVSGFATLSVGNVEEVTESEPNNAADKANRVEIGAGLNGRLNQPNDVDRFVFTAKKGQKFMFRELTRSRNSPCDLLMQLLNAKGGQVAVTKDSDVNEGSITYTFPADGDYTLVVRDLNYRGGDSFSYRIAVTASQPGFSLTVSADAINVPAGGTASVEVKATRSAYNGPIQVAVTGLPTGITSVPTVIGTGLNSVLLTLRSSTDAKAGSIAPVRIVGTAKIGEAVVESSASISDALRSKFHAMPWPPQILADRAAVAVSPKAPFSLRTEPAKIVVKQKGKTSVKVIVERSSGFDEPITLALNPLPKGNPSKGGLPGGLTAVVKPIPKGKNEIEIVFSANDKAPIGEFTATLVATHKKAKATTTQSVPGIAIQVKKP